MKMLTIEPVDEPASFTEVKFSEKEFTHAKRVGPVVVPSATAMEALKNSRGLYRIRPEKVDVEVKVGGQTVEEMSVDQLKMAAISLGVSLRKKSMRIGDLRRLVRDKLNAIEVEIDE